MERGKWKAPLVVLAIGAAAGGLLAVVFGQFVATNPATPPAPPVAGVLANFAPPGVREAPAELQPVLLEARRLMDSGWGTTPPGVHPLRCTSCHFSEGVTSGGRNGGFSLVGSAASYPQFRRSPSRVLGLADQINACLTLNVGAPALAADDERLVALATHVAWISRGLAFGDPAPWLRPPALSRTAGPPQEATDLKPAAVFRLRCAVCHGPDGHGTPVAPPLWGPHSFATGSAMAERGRLAAFVHLNMPRENPILGPAEAFAAASFVLAQERRVSPESN